MGGTAWRNLKMEHRRKINIQEHRQEPGRRPIFHIRKLIYTERVRQILVGLGGWIQIPILGMTIIIYKAGDIRTATLVQWRGALIFNIAAKG